MMAEKSTAPGAGSDTDAQELPKEKTPEAEAELAEKETPEAEPAEDKETDSTGAPEAEPAEVETAADADAPGEADTTDEATDDEPAPTTDDGPPPRRRLTSANAAVALLLALLGFALVVQLKAVATDPTLASARQEDLVRILSDLDSREERLRQDIADLAETQRQLTTAGEGQEAALAEATRRADELGILAGILPVEGPGLTVRIQAGIKPISAATLLDAVQELRGAGAEAIQIAGGNGTQIRVVASTYFIDTEGRVVVDGETLSGPYTLTVVGEPSTLAPALNIPGGVVESVYSSGGTVIVQDEPGVVQVSAVRAPVTLQYARPVS